LTSPHVFDSVSPLSTCQPHGLFSNTSASLTPRLFVELAGLFDLCASPLTTRCRRDLEAWSESSRLWPWLSASSFCHPAFFCFTRAVDGLFRCRVARCVAQKKIGLISSVVPEGSLPFRSVRPFPHHLLPLPDLCSPILRQLPQV